MKRWMRRVRGALGIALSWAVAWFGAGALVGILFFGGGLDLATLFNGILFGVAGFIGGGTFGGLLVLAEGRRTFDQMSLPRFAVWGALGGLIMSELFLGMGRPFTMTFGLVDGVVAFMGAASAAGSLAIARRAGGNELIDAGEPSALLEGD